MIINAGGGYNPLNFKVVQGATAPESPGENTIWVNTEGMTGWVMSAAEPQEPTEGLVWIDIGADGPIGMNALKQNGILLAPTTCRIYTGGAWELAQAQIWQGAWKELMTDLIIYDGTVHRALSYQRVTEETGYLKVNIPTSGNGGAYAELAEGIDLGPYKVFEATFAGMTGYNASSGSRGVLEIYDSEGNRVAQSGNYRSEGATMTLDISGLTGVHKPRVQFHNASSSNSYTAKITGIQLLLQADYEAMAAEYADMQAALGILEVTQ